MTLTKNLERLADTAEYAGSNSTWIRWGQMLRAVPSIDNEFSRLLADCRLVRLGEIGAIRGGVVTRANGYFLLQELPFEQIPSRLRVTRSDLKRIAVVVDGLGYIFKVEREFLRPVLKGPDSLVSAFSVKRTDARLFDVSLSKEKLKEKESNGALAYLKRGETIDYKTSSDELKGGVPAERSQIKNRKPFWYSLQTQGAGEKIVFPEHIDKRYVSTLIAFDDPSVVIDKLFSFSAKRGEYISFIHAGMNSLLAWYQIELRGRSQLGEGVLELKIPDYEGILLADPCTTPSELVADVMSAFSNLSNVAVGPSLSELGSAERLAFDLAYLRAAGFDEPEEMVLLLEQELRALSGERVERKLSVSEAKVSRRKATNVAASIDALAAKIASALRPYPDIREFTNASDPADFVSISGPIEGKIEVGNDLFNIGEVLAGGERVANAGSIEAAQFMRAVLLKDPSVAQVRVPRARALSKVMKEWSAATKAWQIDFESTVDRGLPGVSDSRTRDLVREQVRRLMHVA
ncbi:hypothetical protein CN093_11240 [Sinorhizobium meliloti]|uniref:hypothetical protein n=1 Tax=Rhizobium meliloti TaxID=382 RepID=UPI000FD3FA20|nr:hypothetical protein [Sinorhizobium meliloti]RVO40406.1 hypothetical protein CN093_11240 [Sinorhizobium meliloti]